MNAITPLSALDPVEQWERAVGVSWPLPDAATIAAGDEYARLAGQHWAAAGLSEAQIRYRFALAAGPPHKPEKYEAAIAFARHAAFARVPASRIATLLGKLAAAVPQWAPVKPIEIAELVEVSIAAEEDSR